MQIFIKYILRLFRSFDFRLGQAHRIYQELNQALSENFSKRIFPMNVQPIYVVAGSVWSGCLLLQLLNTISCLDS